MKICGKQFIKELAILETGCYGYLFPCFITVTEEISRLQALGSQFAWLKPKRGWSEEGGKRRGNRKIINARGCVFLTIIHYRRRMAHIGTSEDSQYSEDVEPTCPGAPRHKPLSSFYLASEDSDDPMWSSSLPAPNPVAQQHKTTGGRPAAKIKVSIMRFLDELALQPI